MCFTVLQYHCHHGLFQTKTGLVKLIPNIVKFRIESHIKVGMGEYFFVSTSLQYKVRTHNQAINFSQRVGLGNYYYNYNCFHLMPRV